MKKIWFRRKLYGWGWRSATWQGWLATFIYLALLLNFFSFIHGVPWFSDNEILIFIIVPIMILTFIFYTIIWLKGEKPRWQWGKRIEDVADVLLRGGIAVIPTDTTYGIVGSALNEKTVNEIYRLRKRDLDKPFIVLITNKKDLKKFGVIPTPLQEKILDRVWFNRPIPIGLGSSPTSVILPCAGEEFAYLHRGKSTLAFRVPAKRELCDLLRYVGPLVAPSANPQGHPVARTVAEARAYFGQHVEFYEDAGTVVALPSKLIDITDGTEKVLR